MRTTGPVADSFLARLDAEEASRLSPLAVRSSQTRGRLVAEGLRAAQPVPARPRPHRPLQGVPAPQAQDAGLRRARGRPLPHAPHAHARGGRDLAHRRARAAPQRGPHRGHRPRPRPRPPAVRPRRRGGARPAPCASASSGGFRHNEHSLRVVDVLERDGRGLNLTHEVRDGILNHTGPVAPESLEGRIVKLVDRVAYINHDIDDALRAGVLDAAELPDRARRAARRDRLGAHRRDRARPRRDLRRRRRHPPERAGRRGDARRCARSCSSASTGRGRCARRPTAPASSCAASSPTSATTPATWATATRRSTIATRVTDHVAGHDRPLRAAPLRGAAAPARPGGAVSGRLTQATIDEVTRARRHRRARARRHGAAQGRDRVGRAAARSTRSARGRSTSIPSRGSTTATAAAWAATSSRTCGRATRSTSWARWSGWPSASTSPLDVRGGEPRDRGAAARRGPPARAAGADRGLLPPRPAREPAGRGRARLPDGARRHLGDGGALPARVLAGRAAGHRGRAQARASPTASSTRPGITRRGPHGARRSHGRAG